MKLAITLPLVFLVSLTATLFGQDSQPATGDAASEVSVPIFPNANCPIMGKPISTKLWVDTFMGRIYVCCKACNKRIAKDPEGTHKVAYPNLKKLDNAVCPITGDKIKDDSPIVVLQGHEFKVSHKDCVAKVQAQSQLVLTRLTNPKAVDVANKTCPVTGKPSSVEVLVVVDDAIVRLSAPDCVDEFKKDPKALLAKAKAKAGEAEKSKGDNGAE